MGNSVNAVHSQKVTKVCSRRKESFRISRRREISYGLRGGHPKKREIWAKEMGIVRTGGSGVTSVELH